MLGNALNSTIGINFDSQLRNTYVFDLNLAGERAHCTNIVLVSYARSMGFRCNAGLVGLAKRPRGVDCDTHCCLLPSGPYLQSFRP
jgi:hypothetical protein